MGAGYKQPVSVLVVIHDAAGDILLLERAANPGFWQSVTGSSEVGEALHETARREVGEETGLAVDAEALHDWRLCNRYEIYPAWAHRYAPGVSHNLEHLFSLCVPRDAVIRLSPREHRDWRWLPWREAAAACFSWSNRDAIHMLGLGGERDGRFGAR